VLLEPHHDGSLRHVSTDRPDLGERVTVRLRVPTGLGIDRVHVRTVRDAEPFFAQMRVAVSAAHETWWEGQVEAHNPVTSYRFLADGEAGYGWVNATGWHRGRDVLDVGDFLLSAHPAPPEWVADAVVVQVFPDRFARSTAAGDRPLPDWATPSRWDEPVTRKRGSYAGQVYGGDLDGVREHLDHLERLGANVLYLTPFFPAGSAHRYDAASFAQVDPLLGGDAALARLVAAAHARGIRVLGDLTTNHTGNRHEWFRAAQADARSPEAGFYFFDHHPNGYLGWFGHRTLPKLDWRSEALREAFLRGPDSVVGRWLRPPADLDGWRIDVANMTGRHRDIDEAHSVAAEIRATMRAVRPDGWLVAEHAHAAGPDLGGAGWHGTMNYAGFTRPVWTWLADHRPGAVAGDRFLGVPTGYGVPSLPGRAVVAAIREATATMPWRALVAGMNALDTHDTARFITIVGGDLDRYAAGLTLLFTMPGAPMVFAGAETGIGGADGELARFPIPWDRPADWIPEVLGLHEELAALRRGSVALRRGGLRWLAAEEHALVFEREAPDGSERIVVLVSRAPHPPVILPGWWFEDATPLFGTQLPARSAEGAWRLPAGGPAAHVWRVR
jgi:alpha-glucosidase